MSNTQTVIVQFEWPIEIHSFRIRMRYRLHQVRKATGVGDVMTEGRKEENLHVLWICFSPLSCSTKVCLPASSGCPCDLASPPPSPPLQLSVTHSLPLSHTALLRDDQAKTCQCNPSAGRLEHCIKKKKTLHPTTLRLRMLTMQMVRVRGERCLSSLLPGRP